VGVSREYSTGDVSGRSEEVVANTWRIFSGLIIIVWFSRERSSPSLCRSLDCLVSISSHPIVVPGW
jgi:hypothetical protein